MLEEFLTKLCEELNTQIPKLNEKKVYTFHLNEKTTIFIHDLKPGISFQSEIDVCPFQNRETLFLKLMQANLLGQGTGGARIGLDAQEKHLTLSLGVPYEVTYEAFRQKTEDFANYLSYWREEIEKFQREF